MQVVIMKGSCPTCGKETIKSWEHREGTVYQADPRGAVKSPELPSAVIATCPICQNTMTLARSE